MSLSVKLIPFSGVMQYGLLILWKKLHTLPFPPLFGEKYQFRFSVSCLRIQQPCYTSSFVHGQLLSRTITEKIEVNTSSFFLVLCCKIMITTLNESSGFVVDNKIQELSFVNPKVILLVNNLLQRYQKKIKNENFIKKYRFPPLVLT